MNYTKAFAYLRDQKAFTAFLTTLVVIGSFSVVFAAKTARADIFAFDNASDKLSDASTGSTATHLVSFSPGAENGGIPMGNGGSALPIVMTFTGFTAPVAVVDTDISITGATYINTGACDAGAADQIRFVGATSGLNPAVSLELCDGDTIATTETVAITIGNAKLVNPGAIGSYNVNISAVGATDTFESDILVAIVDKVRVRAAVDPIFAFTVSGVNAGTAIPSVGNTGVTTTPSTIDFGTLASGTPVLAAQTLQVRTNANQGYNVYARTDSEFQSANGAIIDGFALGTPAPSAWERPAALIGDDRTWGHFGLSSTDLSATAFTVANTWVGNFIDNPDGVSIMSGARPVDAANQGTASVLYQTEITDLQEAATDYKTDIIYVATPTF